ncbi:MAG: NfeD family protein [Caulobacterales bacterium]
MRAFVYWLCHPDNTHWFVLALILLIAELMAGSLYLLWPAVAAGVTGLCALFFGWGLIPEIALFSALTIGLTIFGRPMLKNRLLPAQESNGLNERDKSMVGMRGVASATFVNGMGEVRLQDTIWRANSAEGITAGQAIEVTGADGTIVTVKGV